MGSPVTVVMTGMVALLQADPTLGTVYSRHNVADLEVPATTVAPTAIRPRSGSEMVCGSETIMPWDVTLVVRVHTSYAGAIADQNTAVVFADALIDKLRANLDAIDGAHILDVSAEYRQSFEESDTVGAQVTVTVLTHSHYTQE